MAVRHGYGKIAGADALVFAYDTGDTRNSYRGEPTVNLVTNGNFSNGITGWGYIGSAASYSEVTTFEGRTVFKSNGLTHYSDRGYIYQTITGLTSGATYTISFDYYIISGQLTYDPDSASNNNASLTSPTGVWKTHTDTFTAASTAVTLNFWGINGNPGYFYITNIQCELKSHKTPFVNGTRSATQGLLDLTGNSTVDISPTSFNSNAEIEYDGSNDYIYVGSKSYSFPNGATVEQVIKPITLNRYQGFFTLNNYGAGSYINFWMPSSNVMRWEVIGTTSQGYSTITTTTAFQTGQYYHVVGTFNGTTIDIYLNGVLEASSTMTNQPTSMTAQMDIGRYGGDYPSSAQIPITKFYTRPLTAAEVRNNYNNYKSRFNI